MGMGIAKIQRSKSDYLKWLFASLLFFCLIDRFVLGAGQTTQYHIFLAALFVLAIFYVPNN